LTAPAEPSSLQAFLRRLIVDLCPNAVEDLRERVATMRCPKPPANDVAEYAAGRIAVGLFAEPQSLDLPRALLPGFLTLADELDRAIQSGAAALLSARFINWSASQTTSSCRLSA
jgi:hypothetical protein